MIAPYIANWALNRNTATEAAHASVSVSATKAKKPRKKKERVLKSKGGGSPPPPDPMAEAQARNWESEQAANRAKAVADAEKAAKAIDDANKLNKWQGNVANAMNAAQNYGRSKLAGYGLDTSDKYGIWSTFMNNLQGARNSLEDNADYSASISSSTFDNALSDVRGNMRNKYRRDFDKSLGRNYLDTTFADTIDDSILDSIIGDQYNTASTALTNARDRGQMSNDAFTRALASLDTRKNAARGEIETIGLGTIKGLRNQAQSAYDDAVGRANEFDFGDDFDVGTEARNLRSKSDTLLKGLDTAIRRDVGEKSFFDPNSIIAKAVAAGGATNYTPAKTTVGSGSAGNGALGNLFTDQSRNKRTEGLF